MSTLGKHNEYREAVCPVCGATTRARVLKSGAASIPKHVDRRYAEGLYRPKWCEGMAMHVEPESAKRGRGRPPIDQELAAEVVRRVKSGEPHRHIAEMLGVGVATVSKYRNLAGVK